MIHIAFKKVMIAYILCCICHCLSMNHNPIRKSTKKKVVNHKVETNEEVKEYIPGDKYKEPEVNSLYDFLDVQAFSNELKEIEDNKALKQAEKPWYLRYAPFLYNLGFKD